MSTGKLKAQYNRVRTSVALQANSMWTKTIGVVQDPQAGSNAVIEASLKAPTHGGRGREARREAAKALIEEAGYEPAVTSFEGLVALARAQGSIGGTNRGACKICGGMGHLTKQCKNHLSSFFNKGGDGGGKGGPGGEEVGLPLVREASDVSSLSSGISSEDEGSSSDAGKKSRKRRREKRKKSSGSRRGGERSRKSSSRREKRDHRERSDRGKEEKRSSRKHSKSKKHKRSKPSHSSDDLR